MIFNCDALGKSIEVITFSIPISCLMLYVVFYPREDKGDREGIPHTHPIP